MKIVVIGAGEVGFHLAKYLTKEAHHVTIVDVDRRRLATAGQTLDVQTIHGHGSDDGILRQAGVAQADLVISVTNNDELNMLASMVSKKLGAQRTIVRVRADRNLLDHQFFYKDTLGFDLTISPDEMGALEVVRICRGQNALPVENFAGGKLQMRRIEIEGGAPGVGRTLTEVKLPKKVLVTAITRDNSVFVPGGDSKVQEGDLVVLLGVPDALDRAERVLGGRQDLPRRIIVVGGGTVARLVANNLHPLGVTVLLVEEDEATAERLTEEVEGAEVVLGRGTDSELLVEEGIESCDVFVSMTESDEVNILSCQLAKSLGASRTVALVNRTDYVSLVDRLDIDHSLRPRRLVARRIARFVRGEGRSRIAILHHGQAEVLDQIITADSELCGKALRDVSFPDGCIVGGIVRGEDVSVPDGGTSIQEGDHLIIIAQLEVVPELESLFEEDEGVTEA